MNKPRQSSTTSSAPPRALRDREFRVLWLAYLLSLLGDWLARLALALLVFQRTGSAALTATATAASFLPDLLGVGLAGLADRFPRRRVMIVCDLLRAVVVAMMVLPGVPVAALIALMYLVGLAATPFTAARAALTRDIFADDSGGYGQAQAVSTITFEVAQVAGFAVGGVLAALLGARGALAVDAVTFLASAGLVAVGVNARPAPGGGQGGWWRDLAAGTRLVLGKPAARLPASLGWLTLFYIAPIGLAIPYARSQHAGGTAAGLLLAADPAGAALGGFVISRVRSDRRQRQLMMALAVACGLPLLACALQPPITVVWFLLAASGCCASYFIPARTLFALAIPKANLGQAVGLVQAGLSVAQGVGVLAAGVAADYLSPLATIAVSGAFGSLVAVLLAASHHRYVVGAPQSAIP
jgi:MFS family permease